MAPAARRNLKGLTPVGQARIREAAELLSLDPYRVRLTKLKGVEDEWRLRVGEYRVRLGLDANNRTVYIYSVRHRREAYR